MEPDPNDEPTHGSPGTGEAIEPPSDDVAPGGGTPGGGPSDGEGALDDEDAELDAKWGFAPSRPLVGHGAPPVVAILVTKDPGDWFEDTLESLRDQDYERLSVLVIDNGSEQDPTARIAEVLPSAYVKRLAEDVGFSAAANEALSAVEGSAFHLILHDDVRLAPDAVTALVAEAFRANAGIVGPKLVEWDDPSRLLSVGYSVDPFGYAASISEPGELDQSQHDTPHGVFAVSSACMLIRSDLFRTINGFSEDIPFFGEDIDLCWRAHVAGATVHLCPSAKVAHRMRFEQRRVAENAERLSLRHQARMMLANYELFRVMRVLPVVAVLSLVDLVGSLVLGRFRRASDVVASWLWNLVNVPSLLRARSRTKGFRRAHDGEYQPLMRQGSSRLSTLVRLDEGESRLQSAAEVSRGYLRELTVESNRAGLWLAVVVTVVMLVGMRDLLSGPLPVLREFFDPGDSGGQLLSQWWSGWRSAGLGEQAVAPLVVPGLGFAGTVLFGSLGLVRRVLILAPLLVGALGAWKLFVGSGSMKARAAALAAYGLNPVALNAMAEGRLAALVAYGAAPWLLRRAARSGGAEPFVEPGSAVAPRLRAMAGSALVLVGVAAFSPFAAALLAVAVLVLSVAPLVSGQRDAARRMALHVLGAGAAAAIASVPWLVSAITAGDGASLTGLWAGRAGGPSAAELITGSVGPISVGIFGWGVVVAAGYSLVAGRSWRFGWAVGGWALAIGSWAVAVLLVRSGWSAGAGVELILVAAALGIAVSVAMGALAFEHDVVGSDFGISQLLSFVGAAALVVGLVPVAVASAEGRWYQPDGDFRRVLRVVDDGDDFRTVWLGDPDSLPMAGWSLPDGDGLAVGTSSGLDPLVTDRYRLDGGPGAQVLSDALGAALSGETTRLGRVLAPMGVRYLVAVDRSAPEPFAPQETPLPEGALAALREQLDLQEITINTGVALFRVVEPWPLRGDLADTGLPEGDVDIAELLQTELEAPTPLLSAGAGPGTRFSGDLPAGASVANLFTDDSGWSLRVDGDEVSRSQLLGWAQRFEPTDGGPGELRWATPWSARVLQLVQLGALALLVVTASRRRRLITRVARRVRNTGETPLVVVGDPAGSEVRT